MKRIKILIVMVFCMLSITNGEKIIDAKEQSDIFLTIENLVIISDTTVWNSKNDENYIFKTKSERDEFLKQVKNSSTNKSLKQARSCLPGDPGYPNCNGNVVVRVTSKAIGKTKRTGYYSKGSILGKNGWAEGPVTISFSRGTSYNITMNIGVYGSISVSANATVAYNFPVPRGKDGNITYKTKFDVTPMQYIYHLQNGKTRLGTKYQRVKHVKSSGKFAAQLRRTTK